jgi:hypothetical protein
MATLVEMQDITRLYDRSRGRKRYHSETVTDATSSPVLIPVGVEEAGVAVSPGTDALVEFTLSSYDAIKADTATWYAWPAGAATADTADTITGAATAIRMTSTGASSWEVTA